MVPGDEVTASWRKLKVQQDLRLRGWLLSQCAGAAKRKHPFPESFPGLALQLRPEASQLVLWRGRRH